MARLDYRAILAAFQGEHDELKAEEAALAERLTYVQDKRKMVVSAMADIEKLLATEVQPEVGAEDVGQAERSQGKGFEITAGVREVLKEAAHKLSAPEIRDRLVARGWDTTGYKNPLAVIHEVLKRLVDNGEVRSERGAERGNVYFDGHEEKERYTHEAARRVAAEDLPDQCYQILREYGKALAGPQIFDRLIARGFDMSPYMNRSKSRPVNAIAQALGRVPGVETFRGEYRGAIRTMYRLKGIES